MMNNMDVSRETLADFEIYEGLLVKWNKKINLVSPNTIENSANRHFSDSLQLMKCLESTDGDWYDLGSGGGFPGLVCAIAAKKMAPNLTFYLVESDSRKASFLKTVLREVNANAFVIVERIEALPPTKAQYISARALASVTKLLSWSEHLIGPETTCLFLKGSKVADEISIAKKSWKFSEKIVTSMTDPSGAVLVLKDVHRV